MKTATRLKSLCNASVCCALLTSLAAVGGWLAGCESPAVCAMFAAAAFCWWMAE